MEKSFFSEDEVYKVIQHFGSNKSPGPDGFSMEFYKFCRHIIKADFMRLMEEFFRLKTVMHKLVSDFQGAFIKGKQILDGVLIAGECVDSRLKDKKPGILCKIDMEKAFDNILSKLVDDVVLRKQIYGFQVVEGGTMISHLQFAYDALLFVDANADEVKRLLLILTTFELLTCMKLNLEKSTMICVGADEVIQDLALELGCIVEKFPFKYLGLPIGATARSTAVWDEVVARMDVKLETWKKKFLSREGRLVLIMSCLASFPVYFLTLVPMPVSVEKKLNKLMRNFLWNSS
ncbi:uncharacterized protein LOC113296195 [Papaver somniferum]|uniref:uncharacterized protein LOC113296195 n=1 Tax=Papaver somniferum TaxID=3469 RepID=UPI000E702FFD|nr:uncharacterized protein LOC113296195 [Papaver somniferum]